jgi:hypothetical protein
VFPAIVGNKRKHDNVDGASTSADTPESLALAALVLRYSPMFHFAGSEQMYFERPPYLTGLAHPNYTRFFGIAPACNSLKQKVRPRATLIMYQLPNTKCQLYLPD